MISGNDPNRHFMIEKEKKKVKVWGKNSTTLCKRLALKFIFFFKKTINYKKLH